MNERILSLLSFLLHHVLLLFFPLPLFKATEKKHADTPVLKYRNAEPNRSP